MNREELLLRAKDIVNSDVIKGFTADVIKKTANTDPEKFSNFLKEISEQAWDPKTEESTIRTYSKELVDIAKELYPKNNDYPFIDINEQKIKGGKGDKMSIKKIAKKFDVDISAIKKELKLGKEVETEHTKNTEMAKDIAMDHLSEIPDYYTMLKKFEKRALEKWKVKNKNKKT
jgi:hypothetical protein